MPQDLVAGISMSKNIISVKYMADSDCSLIPPNEPINEIYWLEIKTKET